MLKTYSPVSSGAYHSCVTSTGVCLLGVYTNTTGVNGMLCSCSRIVTSFAGWRHWSDRLIRSHNQDSGSVIYCQGFELCVHDTKVTVRLWCCYVQWCHEGATCAASVSGGVGVWTPSTNAVSLLQHMTLRLDLNSICLGMRLECK